MAKSPRTSTTSWRRNGALILALAGGGCSGVGFFGGDYASLIALTRSSWNAYGRDVSRETVLSIPYASIGYRFGKSGQNMLLLVGNESDPRLWTANAEAAIVTVQGRVVRTAGFGHNLGDMKQVSIDADKTRWRVDFPDLERYSVFIACQTHRGPTEDIVILGRTIRTQRIDETCASQTAGFSWSFDNTYWVDATTGTPWRSIQHIHPRLSAIEIETLRPIAP